MERGKDWEREGEVKEGRRIGRREESRVWERGRKMKGRFVLVRHTEGKGRGKGKKEG